MIRLRRTPKQNTKTVKEDKAYKKSLAKNIFRTKRVSLCRKTIITVADQKPIIQLRTQLNQKGIMAIICHHLQITSNAPIGCFFVD